MNILIVDDEVYFRRALKVSIPFEALDFKECFEAGNGIEALKVLEENSVQIVLSDINMGKMNGLNFIKEAKEKYPHIKFIIISGYDDFDFAKRAITLGVLDYITKPIEEENLINTLKKTINTLKSEQLINEKIEFLTDTVEANQRALKKHFISKLLTGDISGANEFIKEKFKDYDVMLNKGAYAVIHMQIDSLYAHDFDNTDKKLWTYAIENLALEMFNFEGEVLTEDLCKVYMLLGNISGEADVLAICNKLKNYVLSNLNFSISISVSGIKETVSEIQTAFNEVNFVCNSLEVLGTNAVVSYKSLEYEKTLTNPISTSVQKNFITNLRAQNKQNCIGVLDDIYMQVFCKNTSVRVSKISFMNVLLSCFEYLTENNMEHLMLEYDKVLNKVTNIDDAFIIYNTLKEFIETIIIDDNAHKSKDGSEIVKKAKHFIENNYSDCFLNIETIAKEVFTSYGHLCYVFKNETGTTINDYITDYRMNKAYDMLVAKKGTVLAVSLSVGFSNSNYFSKVFKKKFNVSPSKLL